MAGKYTIGETKTRPGVFHRTEKAGGNSTASAMNGIGAGVLKANWGPLNKVLEFDAGTSVKTIFGEGQTQDLITEMFNGGIQSGYFIRIGTGGTAPTITLKAGENDAGTITGLYVGDRAFTITIRDSLTEDARECIIYDGTAEFAKVTFEGGDNEPANLAAAMKAANVDFVFTPATDAAGKLDNVAQAAFTAGTNPTVTNEAYSAGFNALEPYSYNVVCIDTTDAGVQLLLAAYIDRIYEAGAYPMACVAIDQEGELDARMKKAAAFNNEKIIAVLNSAIDAAGAVHSDYRLAARIGGLVAATPANRAITHTVMSGFVDLGEALTNTQIAKALKNGCLVLTTSRSGQVWVEQGINTLVTPSADQDEGWKKIRRVKARFELMQRVDDSLEPIIGQLDNDVDGRATVVATGNGVIKQMVAEKKLTTGTRMLEDSANPPAGDSAWFVFEVYDPDTLEKIYLNYRFRFSTADK